MTVLNHDGTLDRDGLRQLFLFDALTDEQLDWLAARGWTSNVPAGTTVFHEAAPAEELIMLLTGTITMSRRVGQDEIEIVRSEQVGAYAGAMQSYLADRAAQKYNATLRALTDCSLFVLSAEDFAEAMHKWFPMAIHLLEGLFFGMRNSQQLVGERQRLLALGALSAGLTHELNNPAAAAVRATAGLRTRVAGMRSKLEAIADSGDMSWVQTLVHMQDKALKIYANRTDLTPLEEADREDELTEWLDRHDVGGSWELAPIFAAAGTTTELFDRIAAMKREKSLEGALRWLAYTLETEQLLDEITDSVTRISSLVNSAKQYSNMDRAPYERADIHIGLESTLAMLASKLEGVRVEKHYDRSLPPVPLYVGEMNQVWTNLIDNAVQAMDGSGTLTVSTETEDDCVRVTIADTGPGIPEELQQRIFEPFFTTKPIGQGTGLGLDISYRIVVARHGGDIRVFSKPGEGASFVVRLPLTERTPEAREGADPTAAEAAAEAAADGVVQA